MQSVRTVFDADHVATVWLDLPDKSVNTLTPAMLLDLADAVAALEAQPPAGVIFASAKAHSFVAGADLFEIRKMSRDEVLAFLEAGQKLFSRIARLSSPTVAAINGDCLGGGLELALACRSRVAADSGKISIGLPETKLGILPGWGGTTRLPRLIGLRSALPMILAGKTMPPRKAMKAGIIDEVVRPEALLTAAHRLVLAPAPERKLGMLDRTTATLAFARNKVFTIAAEETRAMAGDHYPAPFKVIDVIRTGYEQGIDAGLIAERTALAELMDGDTAKNLMRLFFLRQAAKRSLAAQVHARPAEVKHAAVIGGGTMGAGIVHALIRAGIPVRLIEVDAKAVSGGLGRVRKMLDDDIYAGRLSALEAHHAFNRVSPTIEWTGLELADLVVEAVVEKMEAKREIFAKLDRLTRPDAVLASNTSSLSVTEMASATAHPARVVGLHFFNPVPKMPLVEIVRTPMSDDASLATVAAVAGRMGKTPVLVNDAPGFVVNRVLIPYLAESIALAAEGTPIPSIDTAIRSWGMPMGPFELLDEIGLDVGMLVLQSLSSRVAAVAPLPPAMGTAIGRGWLGKKSGRGFYAYDPKKKTKPQLNDELATLLGTGGKPAESAEAIQRRLILPMVNEAARLLSEGVTDSADAIDLATVLGTGFAPFRGGLVHFADSAGSGAIVARLDALATRVGPRFEPAPLLRNLAAAGKPLSEYKSLDAPASPAEPSAQPQQTTGDQHAHV